MSKKIKFIFIAVTMLSIMIISGFVLAQTDTVQYSGGGLVATEQISASSSDYGEISESKNSLIKSKASQNYSAQDQKISQQNNFLSRNTALSMSIMSLFFSFPSLIISIYLLLRIRRMG